MKFIIPISNLVIDNVMRLGDVIFIPHHFYDDEIKYDMSVFDDVKIDEIKSIMDLCIDEYQTFKNYTIAMLDYDFSEHDYDNPIPDDEFMVMEKICLKVDRALDFMRINFCQIGHQETMPGLPGIVKGFRNGIVVDFKNKKSRNLLGNVYQLYVQPGIGLYADLYSPENELSDIYKCLFSERTDEVYVNCRSAFTRINEAMYMSNLNSAFVYLMSTLDMVASKKFVNFKIVKSHILPYVAKNKMEYHALSAELRYLSEVIRTEIVHNGKSLYELLKNDFDIKKILGRITMIIVLYCTEVYESEITDFNNLELERNKRKADLKIE